MGSFSELVMSFRLQADVGPDVLASFASIAVPDPGAPALPPANPEDFDWWPDSADCDMSDPWSKDWGAWLGGCATEVYIDSDQRASMIWRRDHWTVTARATWKSSPPEFVGNLDVLGSVIDATNAPTYDLSWYPHIDASEVTTGCFVGYTRYESDPRPTLLWAIDGHLIAENLNPDGYP